MFHPNVYADGSICLDILQNRWSPTYDVSSILVGGAWILIVMLSYKAYMCAHVFNFPAQSDFISRLQFNHFWTNQTPTPPPTLKPLNSSRKTDENMKRKSCKSSSRAGRRTMNESRIALSNDSSAKRLSSRLYCSNKFLFEKKNLKKNKDFALAECFCLDDLEWIGWDAREAGLLILN